MRRATAPNCCACGRTRRMPPARAARVRRAVPDAGPPGPLIGSARHPPPFIEPALRTGYPRLRRLGHLGLGVDLKANKSLRPLHAIDVTETPHGLRPDTPVHDAPEPPVFGVVGKHLV